MNDKHWMIGYALVYFLFAVGTTQMIPFLMEQGYDAVTKGFILSGIAVTTIGLTLLSGILSDRMQKIKVIYLVLYLIFLVGNTTFFIMPWAQVVWLCLIWVSCVGGCYRTTQGLLDTWLLQTPIKERYAACRSIGAFGWAIGSFLIAFLLKLIGYGLIAWVLAIGGVTTIVLLFKLPDAKRDQKPMQWRDIAYFTANRPYMVYTLAVMCLYALGTADMYIVVEKLLDIGGDAWTVGLRWGLQSLMEIPILLYGNQLLKKVQNNTLMKAACVLFLVRFLLYAWMKEPTQFLWASIMQLVTFPIVVLCSKETFDRLAPPALKSTGQMFAMSIYTGIPLLIMPIACGWLVSQWGYDTSLVAVSALSGIAYALLVWFKKKDDPSKRFNKQ